MSLKVITETHASDLKDHLLTWPDEDVFLDVAQQILSYGCPLGINIGSNFWTQVEIVQLKLKCSNKEKVFFFFFWLCNLSIVRWIQLQQ